MTTQARELAGLMTNAGDLHFADDIHLLSDGGVLNFGADNDVTLTHVADTGLLLNSTRRLQFGDSGTYINQSADGVLNLTSDTEVEINATTVDINANVDISGNLVLGGNITIGDADSDSLTLNADLTSHLIPNATNTYDLGTSSKEWRNAYFDGTVTSDAFAGPLTGDVTGNVSGTAATVTGAAQTNITSLGTLTALTGGTGDLVWDTTTLVVDSSANSVGIGTASPARALSTKSSSVTVGSFESTSASGGMISFVDSNTTDDVHVRVGALGDNLVLQAGGAEKMRITSAGRVGIGDTSPFTKLHVEDTSWSSGAPYGAVAYIQGGAVNDLNWGHLLITQSGTTTDTGGRLSFGANGDNPIAGIRTKYKGATYGDLAFLTRPSGGTNTERMVIDSGGNVGINSSATRIYTASFGSSDNVKHLTIKSASGSVLELVGSSNSHQVGMGAIQFVNDANDNNTANAGGKELALIMVQTETSDTNTSSDSGGVLRIFTKPEAGTTAEAMRIDSSGNVLIGQTSQTGYAFAQQLVVGGGTGNNNQGITIQSAQNSQGNLAFNRDNGTTAHGRISYQHGTDYMSFFANNVERMRITDGHCIFAPETGGNGDYTMYVGTVNAGGTGNRYAHVQIGPVNGSMYWFEVMGMDYTASIIEGRAGGYQYNTGASTTPYASVVNGAISTQYQTASGIELVIDTASTGTSNRWGSVTIRGGTDTISANTPLEIIQYSYTSATTKVY